MSDDIIATLVEAHASQISLLQERISELKGMLTVSAQQITLVLERIDESTIKQKNFEERLSLIESNYRAHVTTWKIISAIFVTLIAMDFQHVKQILSLLA